MKGNKGIYKQSKSEAPCRPGITKGQSDKGVKADLASPGKMEVPKVPGISNTYYPKSRS